MLRIAICDDDFNFTGELETLVIQESNKLGIRVETEVFSDGKTLLKSFQNGEHYELIFIDIEMKQIDGITTARRIREMNRTVLLIYVSGYDEYLKELFEVEPFRFLSKPLDHAKFARYFRDSYKRINETDVFYQYTFNKEIRKVPIKDIVYFESRNRIVNIHLKDGSYEHFYGKLNNVEKELAESRQYFLRIHQSYLVNYDYVKKMNFFNITICLMNKELELKISEDRQKQVRQQLCEIAGGKAIIE
jgi:DNA-binding LytR/AlgR family response regulator